MSAESNRVPLAQVPARLRQLYHRPATYNAVWRLIADGVIVAERDGTRLFVDESQLPVIAEELGLAPSTVGEAATVAASA